MLHCFFVRNSQCFACRRIHRLNPRLKHAYQLTIKLTICMGRCNEWGPAAYEFNPASARLGVIMKILFFFVPTKSIRPALLEKRNRVFTKQWNYLKPHLFQPAKIRKKNKRCPASLGSDWQRHFEHSTVLPERGDMSSVVNSTIIVLIPKVRNPQELTHFRPISFV